MRRQLWKLLGGVAVVLLAAQLALTQEAPATGPAEGPATREGRGMRPRRGARMLDELIQELALTEETAVKVRGLFDEFHQAMRDWQRDNGGKLRELFEQAAQAREDGDEARVKELTEQILKLQRDRLAIRDHLIAQLKEVLTPEQLEKVKDIVIEWRMRLRWITRGMDLTDEQKAKLEAIVKDWKEDAEEGLRPERRGANFRALIEKIVTEVVLTDAQRQALAAMEGEEGFFEKVTQLDLTEAQKGQVERFQAGLEWGRRPFRGARGPGSGPAGGPRRPGGPPGSEGPEPGGDE